MFDQFSAALDWMPSGVRHRLLRGVASGLPFEGRRLRSMAEILAISDLPHRFASWYGGFDTELQARVLSDTMRNEIGDGGLAQAFKGIVNACDSSSALDRFLYCDIHSRLVDDILAKGHRMSMGAGLDARVAFVDPKRVDREQVIWLMLALEIWHRLFVDDDGTESAVARVKADFARTPRTLAVPA